MNKLFVWAGLCVLIISNILIAKTRDIALLGLLVCVVGIAAILTHTARESLRRMRAFLLVGVSIVLFQLIFNTLLSPVDRIYVGARTTLQLALISETVFIGMKYISPVRIVSAFDFLPRKALLLVTMTFAFIPILLKEHHSIQIAQYSRGIGSSVLSRIIAPIAILIPLIHRIFQRAEAISYSMLARGFDEG